MLIVIDLFIKKQDGGFQQMMESYSILKRITKHQQSFIKACLLYGVDGVPSRDWWGVYMIALSTNLM